VHIDTTVVIDALTISQHVCQFANVGATIVPENLLIT
jgi:hypothetical protein